MSEQGIHASPFYVDQWLVDPPTGRIQQGDRETRVEPKVMEVLCYLAGHPDQVVTREELEASVWAGTVVGYDALTSTIIKLRKAFEDDSRQPKIVETVSKRGYRLIAPVRSAHADETAAQEGGQTDRSARPYLARPRWRIGVALLALAATALVVWVLMPTTTPPPAASDRPSLVVLPFTNSNARKEQEYFSDGITDDLINDLSRYSGLDVIARRSAYVYKQHRSDIKTIARELGVSYVVDGDVRRDGDRIRVNVQLINAENGVNIWAQRFDRHTENIFEVQDDMRRNIIDALSVGISNEERKRSQKRYTNSFAAYDLFLRGQARLVARASAEDSKQAQELMEQAIKLDPNFARAYAALALIHADAYRFDWTENPDDTRQQALSTGKRAIELDSQSQQAYWILGYIYLFLYEDHDNAIAMAKKSLEIAPSDLDAANVLAVSYAFGDEPAKAKLITTDIIKNNRQYSALVPSVLGLSNLRLGSLPESLAAYDQSLLINPSRSQGLLYRAIVLQRMGRIEDAEFQVFELYNYHPNFDLEVWAARQPFRDKSITQGMVEDLIKAGARVR